MSAGTTIDAEEKNMESNAKNNPTPNINDIPDALFTRAEFHEERSEEAGFSNYSYWRSTIRTFF